MAVTIVVRSGDESAAELSLTLDTPRLVIGRGDGCEVRLPDPSVSHRHASLRQRGGEYVLMDENSVNGTYMDRVRLPPQTPRVVRSGELVRVGRVWLEIRFEPAIVKGSTAAAAKEVALALVGRGLRAQGEEPGPRLTVLTGAEQGRTLIVAETGRAYVIGRAKDVDFSIDDPTIGRRHASVTRKGDALLLQDIGSPSGTFLEGEQLGGAELTWRIGQVAQVGGVELGFDYPAAEAMAEIERSPDERMRQGEASDPPPRPEATPSPSATAAPIDYATPTPTPAGAEAAPIERTRKASPAREAGGWGIADGAVILAAIGVLVLSALGAWWVLGR